MLTETNNLWPRIKYFVTVTSFRLKKNEMFIVYGGLFLKHRHLLAKCVKQIIGDGQTTKFWIYKWMEVLFNGWLILTHDMLILEKSGSLY